MKSNFCSFLSIFSQIAPSWGVINQHPSIHQYTFQSAQNISSNEAQQLLCLHNSSGFSNLQTHRVCCQLLLPPLPPPVASTFLQIQIPLRVRINRKYFSNSKSLCRCCNFKQDSPQRKIWLPLANIAITSTATHMIITSLVNLDLQIKHVHGLLFVISNKRSYAVEEFMGSGFQKTICLMFCEKYAPILVSTFLIIGQQLYQHITLNPSVDTDHNASQHFGGTIHFPAFLTSHRNLLLVVWQMSPTNKDSVVRTANSPISFCLRS
jgi:hypothetical protein